MSIFINREGREDKMKEINPPKPPDKKGPERPTIEAKDKLNPSDRNNVRKSWELTPEQKKKVDDGNKEISDRYRNGKLDKPNGGDPNKGERQLELGKETER